MLHSIWENPSFQTLSRLAPCFFDKSEASKKLNLFNFQSQEYQTPENATKFPPDDIFPFARFYQFLVHKFTLTLLVLTALAHPQAFSFIRMFTACSSCLPFQLITTLEYPIIVVIKPLFSKVLCSDQCLAENHPILTLHSRYLIQRFCNYHVTFWSFQDHIKLAVTLWKCANGWDWDISFIKWKWA